VFKKFRSFVSRTPEIILESPLGRSSDELILPISQPLANLLSILKGGGVRARALGWINFEGMYQASLGRKVLCQKLNNSIIAKNQAPQGLTTKKNRGFGFGGIKESRNPWKKAGEDPDPEFGSTGPIMENDLFSQKGWERRPELALFRDSEGLNLLEHYEKYYEPKVMTIEYNPSKRARIDLAEAREFLQSQGLEPFRYGSYLDSQSNQWQDGYIEFLEKGKGLKTSHQRGWSNNDHYGYDMRLDDEGMDDQGNPLKAVTVGPDGKPRVHFVAGGYSKDARRLQDDIHAMMSNFANVAQKIGKNDQSGVNPELYDQIKSVIGLNQHVKQTTISAEDKDFGKMGAAKALFGKGERVASVSLADWPEADVDFYLNLIKNGLNVEFVREENSFGNLNAFGQEWREGEPQPEGGYWKRLAANKVALKYPPVIQDRIFEFITGKIDQGTLRNMFKMNMVFPECKPANNTKIYSYVLAEQGIKSNPQLIKDVKRVLYTSPSTEGQNFIKTEDLKPIPVLNPYEPWKDKTLSPLWEKGYRWQVKGRQDGRGPDWNDPEEKYGFLGLGEHRYAVYHDKENNRFYLMAPTGVEGERFDPASYGKQGEAMLGGGVAHSGGERAGHVRGIKAGPQTEKRILKILLNGGFGENSKADDVTKLRCVNKAVTTAKYKYASYTFKDAKKMNFSDEQLYEWAVEGLFNFMGDIAFQIGYITPEEVESHLKWDKNKELSMFEKGRWIKVEPGEGDFTLDPRTSQMIAKEGGDYLENPDWSEEDGWGIQRILHRNGIVNDEGAVDSEVWQMIIDTAQEAYKTNPVIPYDNEPAKHPPGEYRDWAITMKNILGENAFKTRVREISKFLVGRMMRATQELLGQERSVTGMGGKNDDGSERDFDTDKRAVGARTPYHDDPEYYGLADEKELRKHWGIEDPSSNEIEPNGQFTFTGNVPRTQLNLGQAPTSNPFEDEFNARRKAQSQPAKLPPAPTSNPFEDEFNARKGKRNRPMGENVFISYEEWLRENEVVFDPKIKPKDGCGFNYEGSPGKIAVSVSGEADTAKSDPIGKKGRNVRKRK
jgi:hypothetical protein